MGMVLVIRRNLVCYILFTVISAETTFATDSDSNATSVKDVNGLTLLNMGKRFNKPLLTLIGMAMTNLHPCGQWNTWSSCTAVRSDYIGIRKRTRKCKSGESLQDLLKVKIEADFAICEGQCPEHYTVTTNGYCMKLYKTSKVQAEAEKQCNDDGGHLINIDSDLKYGDFKIFRQGYTSNIFIGGRRKDNSSPWIRGDGSSVEFFKWGSGDPDNGSNDLCLVNGNNNYWYDTSCSNSNAFLCEISNVGF